MTFPRHLLSINQLNPAQFAGLLDVALALKQRRAAGIPEHALAGQTLAMLFEKPSLRTRLSFEVAMTELGGTATYIRGDEVGIGVREPAADVARVLSRYVQGIMARVFRHQTVVDLAAHAAVPVINGLSDLSHPCQALADLLTIRERFGRTAGLTIVFVGDANNVSRSLADACVLAGARLILACPPGYAFSAAELAAWGGVVSQCHDPRIAVAGAQVLYTDVWTSMGQEAEKAARLAAFAGFCIDEALLARAASDAVIMHCLPAHRGEEISHGAVEHPRSLVFPQAENRLHAQKALLRVLLARDGHDVLARAIAAAAPAAAASSAHSAIPSA